VSPGARIDLITGQGSQQFEVNEVSIVDALDVSPLDDTDANVLTLITCYPFYYEGFAPDLYIVRARRIPESTSAELADSAE
jgi:sortase A